MSPESQIESAEELADLKLEGPVGKEKKYGQMSAMMKPRQIITKSRKIKLSGQDEYDYAGFALMIEDKFQEFYDLYHEALGDERRYQRYPTR